MAVRFASLLVAPAIAASVPVALDTCSGSGDPPAGGVCYQGKGSILGISETVTVTLKSFAGNSGVIDLKGTGVMAVSCSDKKFTKSGQDLTLDTSGCLKSYLEITKLQYCSDTDNIYLELEDKDAPIPVHTTLDRITCPAAEAAHRLASEEFDAALTLLAKRHGISSLSPTHDLSPAVAL